MLLKNITKSMEMILKSQQLAAEEKEQKRVETCQEMMAYQRVVGEMGEG